MDRLLEIGLHSVKVAAVATLTFVVGTVVAVLSCGAGGHC